MSTWDKERQGLGFVIQSGLNRNTKLAWARKHKKARGCYCILQKHKDGIKLSNHHFV